MSDSKKSSAEQELIRAAWDEARDLIKRLEGSSVQRFAVEAGGTRIEIERGIPTGVAAAPAAAAGAGVATAAEDGGAPELDGRHAVVAPLVGTFYRSSQPGSDPFVKEGDSVEVGQTIAIVEAMKLMNQVQAEVAGTVVEILAEDAQWVEFEQVLMYIQPASED